MSLFPQFRETLLSGMKFWGDKDRTRLGMTSLIIRDVLGLWDLGIGAVISRTELFSLLLLPQESLIREKLQKVCRVLSSSIVPATPGCSDDRQEVNRSLSLSNALTPLVSSPAADTETTKTTTNRLTQWGKVSGIWPQFEFWKEKGTAWWCAVRCPCHGKGRI